MDRNLRFITDQRFASNDRVGLGHQLGTVQRDETIGVCAFLVRLGFVEQVFFGDRQHAPVPRAGT